MIVADRTCADEHAGELWLLGDGERHRQAIHHPSHARYVRLLRCSGTLDCAVGRPDHLMVGALAPTSSPARVPESEAFPPPVMMGRELPRSPLAWCVVTTVQSGVHPCLGTPLGALACLPFGRERRTRMRRGFPDIRCRSTRTEAA
ncbi:hypothetical protein ACWESP_03705 [Nocardia beijingensis]